MISRDNADGVAWGEKAVALATRASATPRRWRWALNMIGASRMMTGDINAAWPRCGAGLEVSRCERARIPRASALTMLGSGLGEMFELERRERYLLEGLEFAEAHELTPWYLRAWLALVAVYRGAGPRAPPAPRPSSPALPTRSAGSARSSRSGVCERGVETQVSGRRSTRRSSSRCLAVTCSASVTCTPPVPRPPSSRGTRTGRSPRRARSTRSHSRSATCGSRASSRTGSGSAARSPTLPMDRRALPAPARRRPVGGRRGVARPRLPLRSGPRAGRRRTTRTSLGEALGELDRLGGAPAAKLVRERLRSLGARGPARPAPDDARKPGRADRARARGLAARRGRTAQRRRRRAARPLAAHRRPPRLGDPAEARGEDARRGGRRAATRLGLLQDR